MRQPSSYAYTVLALIEVYLHQDENSM